MPTGTTSLFTAADNALREKHGINLTDWLDAEVTYRRKRHPRGYADWRTVARRLTEESGVPVSHDTVRRWHQDTEAAS